MLEQFGLIPTITLKEWFSFLLALIAITHPVRIIPLFMGLTINYPHDRIKKIVKVSSLTVLISLSTAIWFGELILHMFGITIGDFQIAGGIVLLLLGLSMLYSGSSTLSDDECEYNSSIAVVPLAIPWIASPGAFTALIVETHKYSDLSDKILLNLNVGILCLLIAIALLFSSRIHSLIGKSSINVASKIMGLIVIAMGIEMFTQGIYRIFPNLAFLF